MRRHLPDHEVRTVVEMGWGGFKNGALLTRAGNGFDAFVTVDKNLPYQQCVFVCHDGKTLPVPAHRPIKPIYVKNLLDLVDGA